MSDESFLARWSRRKTQSRAETPPQAEKTEPSSAADAAVPEPVKLEELPPIETLTADSDYTPFLKPGVPDALKNAALRRLWRSDPVVAGPELLDLHNLDYTLPKVPEVVNTIYRVGKGLFTEADEKAEKEALAAQQAQTVPSPPPACGGRQEGGSQPTDSANAMPAAAAPILPSPATGEGEGRIKIAIEEVQPVGLPSSEKG
jgi:hypothetical protein